MGEGELAAEADATAPTPTERVRRQAFYNEGVRHGREETLAVFLLLRERVEAVADEWDARLAKAVEGRYDTPAHHREARCAEELRAAIDPLRMLDDRG